LKYLFTTIIYLCTIVVSPSAAAAGYTTSATSTPGTIAPGASITFNTSVKSDATATVIVDLEVYQPDGQRVYQQVWDNQRFTAGQSRTFNATWSAPSNAASGTYTIKVGLFAPGWGTMFHWNNGAGRFAISTGNPSTGRYFSTLPPGAKLPSDAECTAAVKRRPENKRMNASTNATRGNQQLPADFLNGAATNLVSRVSGNFTGTTDEILQWSACKWGLDEDMVRAQAVIESWWRQPTLGDWTSNPAACAPGHGLGVDGRAGQCPGSWGILQNRYEYERGAWPGIKTSTAFNADTAYMIWRACYEGYETWLNTVERGQQYAAGDAWGCMGRWFAGRWYTAQANEYIGRVKDTLAKRTWEQPDFQER
jgi:Intracellular proteinase inhibitor